tara:strand:+ start:9673 stop:10167 length:495 start_codon:yes stop_codon:yes gene_type:complete
MPEEQTTYNYQSSNGEYILTIFEGNEDFGLQFPEGTMIYHTFTGYDKMNILYRQLGRDVVAWMNYIRNKTKEEETQAGIRTGTIIIDQSTYLIKVNVNNGQCWLFSYESKSSFDVSEMYIINPDLPLALDGALDNNVRSILTKYGLEIPDVPYKSGLKLTPKDN